MSALIEAALSRARSVLACLFLIFVLGAYSYATIPRESEPDITIPLLHVNLNHEGISPQDAERLLIKPVEQQLRDLEGLKEMRATGYLGGANVVLEFDAGFDVDVAMADVRAGLDAARADLPEDSDEPSVHEINLSLFPVLVVSLSGTVPERTLLELARDLRERIERISSVLRVEIAGDREELLEVVIDPLVLESYQLDARDIIAAVERSNRLVAAGALDTGQGRFAIKLPGLFENADDILEMPVKVAGDAVVRFRDIAQLRRAFKDPEGFARINGRPAVALEVTKRTGENIIETISRTRAVVEAARAHFPPGVEVTFSQDKSTEIRTMLGDLQNNVLSAILLVMMVVVAALGLRSGLLVGVAIPGSFLAGILVLAVFGLTINIVVLFSLILSVGMLVDGAIVVTEYADRKMNEGMERRAAYGLAAKRMAWPIIAATATTLAAFLPLVFWPGMVGEFMKYLPITLLAVLCASLVMALIFVPTLGSLVGEPSEATDEATTRALNGSSEAALDGLGGISGFYLRALRRVLDHPGKVLLGAAGLLICAQVLYITLGRGIEFFPAVEPDNAVVQIRARGNLSIWERDQLLGQVEQEVLELQRASGAFHAVYARSQAAAGTQRDDEPEDLIGTIQLEFAPWQFRPPAEEILTRLRTRTEHLAGIWIATQVEKAGPPVGKPVELRLSSDDPALLDQAASHLAAATTAIGGFVDVEDGLPAPGIEWQLRVDRPQAAKFGADVSLIGSYVQMLTNGMKLGLWRPDHSEQEIDIVIRLPEAYRNLAQLDQTRVQTNAGPIPISHFVERTPIPKRSLIHRADSARTVTLKAEVAPGLLVDDQVAKLQDWLADNPLDPRIEVAFKGEDEEQRAAQAFLIKAFAVALFLMAIILVTQFNSFYAALVILSAVVLSTIGVMLGLLVTGQAFSVVMSGIGVIALAGIVVNNNIVLIDTFDRLRKTAPSPRDAILLTGAQRLRPVLLTTVTTVLGLMPMALGLNIDLVHRTIEIGAPATQWWRQLAIAIVSGLTFATVLTLLITPAALMLREDTRMQWILRRMRRAARNSKAAPILQNLARAKRGTSA
ncbi:MAG: efflux RND transporter permease subunit [Pseudomonadota bacterium]